MPGIDYRELRRRVHMARVLRLVGFQMTWRAGPQLRGHCPIPGCHGASRRSFSVHLAREVYQCFACGAHGNVLDLWAAVHGLPLHRAAVELCGAVGLAPPLLRARRTSPPVPLRASLRNR